jgi:hypothetical protein
MNPARPSLLVCAFVTLLHASGVRAIAEAGTPSILPATGGLPLAVASGATDDSSAGHVMADLDFPFPTVAERLSRPSDWCGFLILHLNTKACVHYTRAGHSYIQLYSGRKFFEAPADAMAVTYRFEPRLSADHLEVVLRAESGPLGTRDYLMHLRAVPRGSAQTSVDLRFSYALSRLARLGIGAYLRTSGSDKVGFTVTAHDAGGAPVYVAGRRGVIERNVVRLYLALIAYLESLDQAPDHRDSWAHARWYELSERYPQQLRELSREEYLDNKRKELAAQRALQTTLDERPLAAPRRNSE